MKTEVYWSAICWRRCFFLTRPVEQTEFEMRLRLVCKEDWVECSPDLELLHSGRTFIIAVDPTQLPPGAHHTCIEGRWDGGDTGDTGIPEISEIPEVPQIPAVPEIPEIPEVPEILDTGDTEDGGDGRDVFVLLSNRLSTPRELARDAGVGSSDEAIRDW